MTEQQRAKFLNEYSAAIAAMRAVIRGGRDEEAIERAEARVSQLMDEAQKAGIAPEEMRAAIEEAR